MHYPVSTLQSQDHIKPPPSSLEYDLSNAQQVVDDIPVRITQLNNVISDRYMAIKGYFKDVHRAQSCIRQKSGVTLHVVMSGLAALDSALSHREDLKGDRRMITENERALVIEQKRLASIKSQLQLQGTKQDDDTTTIEAFNEILKPLKHISVTDVAQGGGTTRIYFKIGWHAIFPSGVDGYHRAGIEPADAEYIRQIGIPRPSLTCYLEYRTTREGRTHGMSLCFTLVDPSNNNPDIYRGTVRFQDASYDEFDENDLPRHSGTPHPHMMFEHGNFDPENPTHCACLGSYQGQLIAAVDDWNLLALGMIVLDFWQSSNVDDSAGVEVWSLFEADIEALIADRVIEEPENIPIWEPIFLVTHEGRDIQFVSPRPDGVEVRFTGFTSDDRRCAYYTLEAGASLPRRIISIIRDSCGCDFHEIRVETSQGRTFRAILGENHE